MIRIIAILLVLLSAGCATVVRQPADASESFVYRLGTGDRLRISVFDEPRLSGEYAVDGTGSISYPLLGPIDVTDKTTAEVRDKIAQRHSRQRQGQPAGI